MGPGAATAHAWAWAHLDAPLDPRGLISPHANSSSDSKENEGQQASAAPGSPMNVAGPNISASRRRQMGSDGDVKGSGRKVMVPMGRRVVNSASEVSSTPGLCQGGSGERGGRYIAAQGPGGPKDRKGELPLTQ